MSTVKKVNLPKHEVLIQEDYNPSILELTFIIEVVGDEIYEFLQDEMIWLTRPIKSLRMSYQIVPGTKYDLEMFIWPHVVKVTCGNETGWVRTFPFVKRWFAFSIRHWVNIDIAIIKDYTIDFVPTNGNPGAGDLSVYLQRVATDKRQFGPVVVGNEEDVFVEFIRQLLWQSVEPSIPASMFDGSVDVPYPVEDFRHQSMVKSHIKNVIFTNEVKKEAKTLINVETTKAQATKKGKEKATPKFILQIDGKDIICGIGTVIESRPVGDPLDGFGDMAVLLSSQNLPANKNTGILFIQFGALKNIPVEFFEQISVKEICLQWNVGHTTYSLTPQALAEKIIFNERMVFIIETISAVTKMLSDFQEKYFTIKVQKIILPNPSEKSKPQKIQGNGKTSSTLGVCNINLRSLSKGIGKIRGEFLVTAPPVPKDLVVNSDKERIESPLANPGLLVPPSIFLEKLTSLSVTIGLIGCKPKTLQPVFSRLFCKLTDSKSTETITSMVLKANEEIKPSGSLGKLLTGWVVDSTEISLIFIEGRTDGIFVDVWDLSLKLPSCDAIHSSAEVYRKRLYPVVPEAEENKEETLITENIKEKVKKGTTKKVEPKEDEKNEDATDEMVERKPIFVLKFRKSLSSLLSSAETYISSKLSPLAKSAILKLDRLLKGCIECVFAEDMPTYEELMAAETELCF